MLAGAGDADVEQAAFLLDRVGRTRALEGVVDREHALVEADEEDGVPLQALGHVDADQGHALHLGRVLGAHPLLEHANDPEIADLWVRGEDLLDQLHEGVEGLPALAFLRTAGFGGGEPDRGECRLRGVEDLLPGLRACALCSSSPARLTGRLAAKAARALRQRPQALPDLGAGEEALPALDLVRDPGFLQGVFERTGLGVNAVQHRDLCGPHPLLDELGNLLRHPLGLCCLIGVFHELRLRAVGALPLQLQAGPGSPALSLADHLVG